MNINYLKAKNKMSLLKSELNSIFDNVPSKTLEDKIAYSNLEAIIDNLDEVISRINHYSKPVIEGTLREMDNGKFELISNGEYVTYFSCGSSIECFCYDEFDEEYKWFAGRVEYKDGGYYFYCSDAGNPFLFTGMTARIRKLS
jgi:hypothetical protein